MVKLLEETDFIKKMYARFTKKLQKSSSDNPFSRGANALEG